MLRSGLVFFFIFFSFKLYCQDIYIINGNNELKTLDANFAVSDLFQINISQAGQVIDLAITPSGKLYGVTGSLKIIEINPDSASFSVIKTLPAGANYPGMVANYSNELILAKQFQRELYSYNFDTDSLDLIEDSISTPGDFTYYEGNLLYPGLFNDYIKSFDGTKIKNVGCSVPLIYTFYNVFDSCGVNNIYAID
ncbi:MAG: hypothetical protein HKN22_06620 [Bacteroidia bacterium]|nr:hypothetical protein [Bacteroidia bacterium]